MAVSHWVSKLKAAAGVAHGSRVFGGPYQVGLGLTNRCNIRCVHCYFYSPYATAPNLRIVCRRRQEGGETQDPDELTRLQRLQADPEKAKGLVRELLRMGTRRFLFTGNGEIFTHPAALDLMALGCRGGAFCYANTNGTLIGRKAADELIRMGFGELRVTLMAGTREMYERTHPGVRSDLFDTVCDNLRYIAERKRALGVGRPAVVPVFIVVAQNVDGVADFARLAADLSADGVLFKPVDDVHDASLSAVIPDAAGAARAKAQLAEARAFLDGRGIRHNIDLCLGAFGHGLETAELYRRIPCYMGWLSALIEPDGTVYPCCRCYVPMGNAFERPFAEVWDGPAYRDFRRRTIRLHRGAAPPESCDCDRCVHHEANIKAHRVFHPLRGRLRAIG